MDKKYCENCQFLTKAIEHDRFEDQVRFARCAAYSVRNLYGDVSLAFDTTSPMFCWIARGDTTKCGPDAVGYKEIA